jgi:hypothetical protein
MILNINQIKNFLAVVGSSPEVQDNPACLKLKECFEKNSTDEYACSKEYGEFKSQIDSKTGIYDFILNRFSLTDVSVDTLAEGEIIPSPTALVTLIRKHDIPLSNGEKTWIHNIEESVRVAKTACCSNKANLLREARVCYLDLIKSCDSNWLFVKNIKEALKIDNITFKSDNEVIKKV